MFALSFPGDGVSHSSTASSLAAPTLNWSSPVSVNAWLKYRSYIVQRMHVRKQSMEISAAFNTLLFLASSVPIAGLIFKPNRQFANVLPSYTVPVAAVSGVLTFYLIYQLYAYNTLVDSMPARLTRLVTRLRSPRAGNAEVPDTMITQPEDVIEQLEKNPQNGISLFGLYINAHLLSAMFVGMSAWPNSIIISELSSALYTGGN
jgi:hypothetical protein